MAGRLNRRKPHTQIGQKGKGTGAPQNRGSNSWLKKHPNGPLAQGGGGGGVNPAPSPGVGGWPQMPPAMPNFLPMTPGYESDMRGLNDQLSAAEGQYAMGQIMTPAQMGLQKQRLTTDMGVATDQLKEDLAGRGVFTARNAQGTYGDTSPAGGGIGQSLYTRKVATPFGRQFQDLASGAAGQYGDMASQMGGAQLGYNQGSMNALLGRAQDAYQQQPMSLPFNYQLPQQAAPMFSNQPRFGKTRPNGRGKGNRPKRGAR